MPQRVEIFKTFRFEASHVLPKHEGKCARLHGHSWVLVIGVEGEIDPETGFVVDYNKLKKLVDEHVVDRLDHTHLGHGEAFTRQDPEFRVNQIIGVLKPAFGLNFYPSSENLVVAIGRIIQPLIKELRNGIRLSQVRIEETCTSAAVWRPVDSGSDTVV
jgi:6-pyruvoyltetrahydropterin/6-carboxytetrahydropterin synthase